MIQTKQQYLYSNASSWNYSLFFKKLAFVTENILTSNVIDSELS